MYEDIWVKSMYQDTDSDGKVLFSELHTEKADHGMIQYGYSAFGFGEDGQISNDIHYPIIRIFNFDPAFPEDGKALLQKAIKYFCCGQRIYAFFHYFGMSACGRLGKLHESSSHVAELLMENGFVAEHENMYYARRLSSDDTGDARIKLNRNPLSPGDC